MKPWKIMIGLGMLLALVLSGCGQQTRAIRGQVVAKSHRQPVAINPDTGSQYLALVPHMRAPMHTPTAPRSTPRAPRMTKPQAPSSGGAAVRSVNRQHFTTSRIFRASPRARVYFPFWYYAAFAARDRHERYLLKLKVGAKTRQVSVSRRMYAKAHIGDVVEISGSHFKILKTNAAR